jgi:hypothetical protein
MNMVTRTAAQIDAGSGGLLDGMLDAMPGFPPGSFELLDNDTDEETGEVPLSVRVDEGNFATLAKALFIHNGHRRGPVPGGFVVVEAVPGKVWCVGQLRADAAMPLRLFRSLVFASKAAAVAAAEERRQAAPVRAP